MAPPTAAERSAQLTFELIASAESSRAANFTIFGTGNGIGINGGLEVGWGTSTQRIHASTRDGRLTTFTALECLGGEIHELVNFNGGGSSECSFRVRHDGGSSAIFVRYATRQSFGAGPDAGEESIQRGAEESVRAGNHLTDPIVTSRLNSPTLHGIRSCLVPYENAGANEGSARAWRLDIPRHRIDSDAVIPPDVD